MRTCTWIICLATVVAIGQAVSQEKDGKRADKLKLLQGRWLNVEGYRWDHPFERKLLTGGRVTKESDIEIEVEFIGNIGLQRKILADGSRSKPFPAAWLVDVTTDPIGCDMVFYPIEHGKPRVHSFGILKFEGDKLYIAEGAGPRRPKSFDVLNDPTVCALMIFRRAKP